MFSLFPCNDMIDIKWMLDQQLFIAFCFTPYMLVDLIGVVTNIHPFSPNAVKKWINSQVNDIYLSLRLEVDALL
jgi:hypothetical protein